MQFRSYLVPKVKWLTVLILALYIVILLAPQLMLSAIGIQDPALSLIDLGIQVCFWLGLIPLVSKIPLGKVSIPEYLRFIRINRFQLQHLVLGLLIGAVSVSSYGLLSYLLYGHTFDVSLIIPPNSWRLIWANTGAIFEEIAIRGVIFSLLLLIHSERKALMLSTLIFGCGHFLTFFLGDTLFESAVRVLYACLLGLVFGTLVLKSNSLYPAILAHVVINSLSSAFSGGVSDVVDFPFLASTVLTFVVSLLLIQRFSLGKRVVPAQL